MQQHGEISYKHYTEWEKKKKKQIQKSPYCMIPFMWISNKNRKNQPITTEIRRGYNRDQGMLDKRWAGDWENAEIVDMFFR